MAEPILQDVVDFFTQPAPPPSGNWEGYLQNPSLAPAVRLALCLDLWVREGLAGFKKAWVTLAHDDQVTLGKEIGHYFLFRPLISFIGPGEKSLPLIPPLLISKQGRIIKVITDKDPIRKVRYYFPIPHGTLWSHKNLPFQKFIFSTLEIQKALQPALVLAAGTRSPRIRERIQMILSFAPSLDQLVEQEPEPPTAIMPQPESPAPSKTGKKSKKHVNQLKLW
jgi:hypothetical protein